MPSGAKKRKAAKKKMDIASNIQSITNSQENNDLKTHDEKESDSGGGDSSDSQKHLDPLMEAQHEEGEENKTVSSSVEPVSVDAANKSMEELEKVEEEVKEMVQVEREFIPVDDFHGRNISIDFVDIVEELPGKGLSRDAGNSSSSSSSSSSDADEKNTLVIESEKLDEGNNVDTKSEITVEPVVVLPEEIAQVIEETPIKDMGNLDMIDLMSKAKEDKMLPYLDKNSETSSVLDLVLPTSDKNGGASDVTDLVIPVNENDGALALIDGVFPLVDKKAGILAGTDSDSMENEVKNEDKLVSSSDAPQSIGTSNGSEHSKEYDAPESSVNQPILASYPETVQRTSWKGCCGLFEVFMGSNR